MKQMATPAQPHRKRVSIKTCLAVGLFLALCIIASLGGPLRYGAPEWLDLPHGGDPLEDRRGLLRHVTEPVLRQITGKIQFRGTLAVEAVEDGQHDLWLVETSRIKHKTTRLTHTPANETDPVWSPDGEWLAYLSDASGPGGSPGKTEVFALRLADGQVVQLTRAPEIHWQGPLTWLMNNEYWSSDPESVWKSWIVLTGAAEGDPSGAYIYHIPVSGDDRRPLRIENTRGAAGLVGMDSLFQPLYGTADGRLVYHPDPREAPLPQVISAGEHARGLELVPGSFGWSVDGAEVIYMTRGDPPDGEVGIEIDYARMATKEVTGADGNTLFAFDHFEVVSGLTARVESIHAILPITGRRFLALQDGQLDGSAAELPEAAGSCLRLHFYDLYDNPVDQGQPALFPELCLDDLPTGLHPQSAWVEENIKHQYRAIWRVMSGRKPGESTSTLYALLFYNNRRYLDMAQLRAIPSSITGEIVPGSMRVRQEIVSYDKAYSEAVGELIDPRSVP